MKWWWLNYGQLHFQRILQISRCTDRFPKKNINKAVKNEATAWLNDFIFILYTGESPFIDKMILTELEKGRTKGNEMKPDIFKKNWFARSQKNSGGIKRTMKKIAALIYQKPKRIKSIIVGSNVTFVRTFLKISIEKENLRHILKKNTKWESTEVGKDELQQIDDYFERVAPVAYF